MKGIYRRPNSQFYQIRYRGLDGRIIRESTGTTKLREAQALLHKRKAQIDAGMQPEVKKIANYTFKQLSDKYSQWMQGRHRSADSKKYRIAEFVSKFGGLKLREFNLLVIEQYQTELLNRKFSNGHINKNISLVKAMIKKAVDWNMVEEDVLKRVRKVTMLPETGRLRYLSQGECRELINICDDHVRPIVVTALHTGMRKSEILKLKWEQIDLKHGFIHLNFTKNDERRDIPISDTLKQTLSGLMRRVDVPYVFYNPKTGNKYKDIKKTFKTALRRCKILDFRFHDLRHTFASHLVMAGVDLTTVKELMGHKDIKMTLRYAHLAPLHKANAISILDSTISGKKKFTDTLTDTYGGSEPCLSVVSH